MNLIDTHSHIYLPAFDHDRVEVMERAIEAGVQKILLPNIDMDSVPQVNKLVEQYPEICYPMMGLHPCDVKNHYHSILEVMKEYLSKRKYVAIGEIGMDLYWDKSTKQLQEDAFRIQIEWAIELDLPIVIHAREAFDPIFKILDEMNCETLRGVFHCFTGDVEQAKKIMGYGGFMMGIGGVITYEKSGLATTTKAIPLEYLVLETDAPYLSPKPYRGKRNESSYIKNIAEKLAIELNMTPEEIAEKTTENALRLFRL